jgi:transcription antitermination factor NusG
MGNVQKSKMLDVSHRAKLYIQDDVRVTAWRQERPRKMMPAVQRIDGDPPEEACWWAVYTRHQHEKTVARMLSGKGIEVFLPLYESTRHWKDRNKQISLPLFPCYLFVRGGHDRRLQVVATPGVHMLLYTGERLARVPETEIHAIRMAVESAVHVEPHPFLKCGERVRVKRGPLAGIEGVLVRKRNQDRLVLSVEMLAQSVGVEIDAADVEPVAATGQRLAIPAGLYSGAGSFQSAQPQWLAGRS